LIASINILDFFLL
jgi:hypothetical protein